MAFGLRRERSCYSPVARYWILGIRDSASVQQKLGPRVHAIGSRWLRSHKDGLKHPTPNKRAPPGLDQWSGGPSTASEASASLSAWWIRLFDGAAALEQIHSGELATLDPDTSQIIQGCALFMRSRRKNMEDSLRSRAPETATVLADASDMEKTVARHTLNLGADPGPPDPNLDLNSQSQTPPADQTSDPSY